MDELLRDFLTETNESIDVVDVELVRFEQDPNNAKILNNIFRLVHTIKGTCGFLNLPRLEALTHAAEALMGKFRDGAQVTAAAVSLILSTIDRVKQLLDQLERNQNEPEGDDRDLIGELNRMAAVVAAPKAAMLEAEKSAANDDTIDELERAFRNTPGPRYQAGSPANEGVVKQEPAPRSASAEPNEPAGREEDRTDAKVANQ